VVPALPLAAAKAQRDGVRLQVDAAWPAEAGAQAPAA
jgi:hypothetical protein